MTNKQINTGAIKLNPVVVKNEAEALACAFNGARRRPVLARDEHGKLVVCSKRTARKNNWDLKGPLFSVEQAEQARKERTKAAIANLRRSLKELEELDGLDALLR